MTSKLVPAQRRAVRVLGLVQGVGFRPHVFRLAARHGLDGFVRNETDGVHIEVEGDPDGLDRFLRDLEAAPLPRARLVAVDAVALPPRGEPGFRILPSRSLDGAPSTIPPDLAVCDDCLREVFDASDRRHRYPFTACASCGPRFTAIDAAPYDRERTSMSAFPLCSACRAEYEDPLDRRHHAEALACPDCGPRLSLDGAAADPLAEAVRRLAAGRILAVKGLGGWHLACDARNERAVAELRLRKGRDAKPFAVLAAGLAEARLLADVSPAEAELLTSSERPIVLLRSRGDSGLAPSVAPGATLLGLMLPYTPLHALLAADAGGPLVLTSGNASDAPIAIDDADARRSLAGIADDFLGHDRRILHRCDDSVSRVLAGAPVVLRRSRGHAPAPTPLPFRCAGPILALGGALKSVFALGRGREAVLSQHLGDLDDYASYRAWTEAIGRAERLFGARPSTLAHDLHPDSPSTRYALERERLEGLPRIAVQHHHAHLASCMAENGLTGPVLGVTFDGTGYGSDGTIWGGEFLAGDASGFVRAAHLEALPMPGGEAAVREPWRMALALLAAAGRDGDALRGAATDAELAAAASLLGKPRLSPLTSSAGRLFDAVASLLGVRHRSTYEGQAAIELEALADRGSGSGAYAVPELRRDGAAWVLPTAPWAGEILDERRRGVSAADAARRFHATLVLAIRKVCGRLREESGLDRVVLSGGVFMNERILAGALEGLTRDGFRVHRHRRVPPNDGGLCLGQLAVAAARRGEG